jgi:hypothetical protein
MRQIILSSSKACTLQAWRQRFSVFGSDPEELRLTPEYAVFTRSGEFGQAPTERLEYVVTVQKVGWNVRIGRLFKVCEIESPRLPSANDTVRRLSYAVQAGVEASFTKPKDVQPQHYRTMIASQK